MAERRMFTNDVGPLVDLVQSLAESIGQKARVDFSDLTYGDGRTYRLTEAQRLLSEASYSLEKAFTMLVGPGRHAYEPGPNDRCNYSPCQLPAADPIHT
jgi:hypothetical protein